MRSNLRLVQRHQPPTAQRIGGEQTAHQPGTNPGFGSRNQVRRIIENHPRRWLYRGIPAASSHGIHERRV